MFPIIEISGTPTERGLEYGEKCKDRILKCIKFYKKIFRLSEEEVFKKAKYYHQEIWKFNKDYCDEIESIAKSAGVDPLWIYALNARTEILLANTQECTAVYFRKTKLLAQNWDWAKDLEELTIILKITREDGHKILMVTEPGIIGKIGFNSSSVGVTLNILKISGIKFTGLPIHIMLRAVLDSKSIKEAEKLVSLSNSTSNLIIADAKGNFLDVEFAGKKKFVFKNSAPVFYHTNHYLGKDITPKNKTNASSFVRYERLQEMKLVGGSVADMKKILLDKENELPICRSFVPYPHFGKIGTISSIIMDLSAKEMHLTKGNPVGKKFVKISL